MKHYMKYKAVLSLILLFSLLLGVAACGSDNNMVEDNTSEQTISTGHYTTTAMGDLITALRGEFGAQQMVDFQESRFHVAANQEFYVDFAFNVLDSPHEFSDILAVYIDIALEEDQALISDYEVLTHEDDPTITPGHSRLIIRPGNSARPIFPYLQDIITFEEIALDRNGEHFLRQFPRGENWGFLSHYYLTLHIDPITGDMLERPQVSIFTLAPSLEAPEARFFVTPEGHGGFYWDPIEGANYYLIVRMDTNPTGRSIMFPIAQTWDTTWIHPEDPSGLVMNQLFALWGAPDDIFDHYIGDTELTIFPFQDFAVVAVNAYTHSAIGRLHPGEVISARMPYMQAWNTMRQDMLENAGVVSTGFVPAIGFLPTHRPISLANGRTVRRSIVYDFENAYVRPAAEGVNFGTLVLPYTIEGTILRDQILVHLPNVHDFQDELEAFRQHMEYGTPWAGGTLPVTIINDTPVISPGETPSVGDEEPDTVEEITIRADDRIFANSAFSAFLARNMLATNVNIDLSAFPESRNMAYLEDAFFEAMYQNPLILHVSGAHINPISNTLVVHYRKPIDVILQQQEAIRQIVPQIIADIITPDMTDLEKSTTINAFLVNWAEYDWAALENAEKFDLLQVDPEFYNSFTAYGILINRLGVCSGFAAAFKLLADEAGLDSIVVTGHLEGLLPHAWNRVYIDGHWHTVDVTNNANEFLFNIFLHLPDDMARQVLVEDSLFVLNDSLDNFRSAYGGDEYFYHTGRFYSIDTIAQALAREIEERAYTTLRTHHSLNDEIFYHIATQVMELLGTQELFGFHWLGVIHMSR